MVMLLRFYKNTIYMRKNSLPSGSNRVPLIIETYINGVSVDRGQNKLILNPFIPSLKIKF
jgi:hypothetical protein